MCISETWEQIDICLANRINAIEQQKQNAKFSSFSYMWFFLWSIDIYLYCFQYISFGPCVCCIFLCPKNWNFFQNFHGKESIHITAICFANLQSKTIIISKSPNGKRGQEKEKCKLKLTIGHLSTNQACSENETKDENGRASEREGVRKIHTETAMRLLLYAN